MGGGRGSCVGPIPAARRDVGLSPPESQGAPSEEGPSARRGRTSSAMACAPPAAFHPKAQLSIPRSVPRWGCPPADTSASSGTAQRGFGYDFVSGKGRSKRSPGGTAQATGLASHPMARPHNRAPVWRGGTHRQRVGTRNGSWEGPSRAQEAGEPSGGKGLALREEARPHPSTGPRSSRHPREPRRAPGRLAALAQGRHIMRVTTMVRKSS